MSGADGDDDKPGEHPIEDLLAQGERLLAQARDTIADLDAAMNTAVNVIPRAALEADTPPS